MKFLLDTVTRHVELTGSRLGSRMLENWAAEWKHFRKVMPRDYKRVLQVQAEAAANGLDEDQTNHMIMEVARG